MTELSAVLTLDPLELKPPLVEGHKRRETYIPAPGLQAAIDVALLLGEPLLLTGDPGVGKTRAAYWLAGELRAEPLLIATVKSTSTGTDLLYSFDEIARFRDSARGVERPLVSYLRFNGLGEAILRGAGGRAVLQDMAGRPLQGPEILNANAETLTAAFGDAWRSDQAIVTASMLLPYDAGFAASDPSHRVLLIDELDKAPRDTPNDLLNEVENMTFRIPELGVQVDSRDGRRPVIVVTSNSEKALPDPFLRRCVYFDIPFPDEALLTRIVERSVDALDGGGPMVGAAIRLFQKFREPTSGIRKAPGTAELLAWLDILANRHRLDGDEELHDPRHREALKSSLTAVLKSKDDLGTGMLIVDSWAADVARARR